MKHIQPYSDAKMLYNEETKQYELKPAWVKANFGNPFSDDNVLEVRIKRNTRRVYNYIFSHGFSGNRKAILAIINHTEEYRNYIFAYLLWKGRPKILTDTIFKESDFEKHKKEEYWRFIYK